MHVTPQIHKNKLKVCIVIMRTEVKMACCSTTDQMHSVFSVELEKWSKICQNISEGPAQNIRDVGFVTDKQQMEARKFFRLIVAAEPTFLSQLLHVDFRCFKFVNISAVK